MIDLDQLSQEEFIEELRQHYFLPAKIGTLEERVKIIAILMKHFGMDENREQIAFILCNYPRVIAEACAGAGKTTSCILKVITHTLFKDIEARNTIMLTYTTKATQDIKHKLTKGYALVNQLRFDSLSLDGEIEVKTIHSFFTDLIYEYADLLNIKVMSRKLAILSNTERQYYMKQIMDALTAKGRVTYTMYDSLPNCLLSLYSQIKERDIFDDKEEWCKCSSFKEVSTLVFTEIVDTLESYERFKRGNMVIEFCEYAKLCQTLLDNPKILERWRKLYTCIMVDEYQDTTESQINVLKKIVVGSHGNILIGIGDGDQSIYGFRGAHANGCVKFPSEFGIDGSPVAVCTMSLNRRCPKEVLGKAKQIIETVSVRNPKNLRTEIPGGTFDMIYSDNYVEEIDKVMAILEDMTDEELSKTVITYRSNRSSRYLKRKIEEKNIRVNMDKETFDFFEETLTGAISLLDDPYNIPLAMRYLYKMVPKAKGFGKQEIHDVLLKEKKNRDEGYQTKDIFSLDFSGTKAPESFYEAITGLSYLSRAVMNEKFTKDYLNQMKYIVTALVFEFLKKYYLEWQDRNTDSEGAEHLFGQDYEILDEYSAYIFKEYTQEINYPKFKVQELIKKERLESTLRQINFSTFHGLKGLEFDTVIAIDMRDTIFPGYELAQATKFGGNFIEMADDEAKRLLYVVMTRAKKNLIMSFRREGPSRYISYLTEEVEEEAFETADLMDDLFSGESLEILPETELTSEFVVQDSAGAFKKTSALSRWIKS